MERQRKRATRGVAVGTSAAAAFGAVELAACPRLTGHGPTRVEGDGPRIERGSFGRQGQGGDLRGPHRGKVGMGPKAGGAPWSAWAGWEARAASAVGAAMVHWLGTETGGVPTVFRRGTGRSHGFGTVERPEKDMGRGRVGP